MYQQARTNNLFSDFFLNLSGIPNIWIPWLRVDELYWHCVNATVVQTIISVFRGFRLAWRKYCCALPHIISAHQPNKWRHQRNTILYRLVMPDLHEVEPCLCTVLQFPEDFTFFHPCSKRCLSSSSNVYIHCLYYELSHKTSPTASEPAAARAAIHFIGANHARRWVIFLHSRGALQALRRLSNHCRQLMCEISEIHTAV